MPSSKHGDWLFVQIPLTGSTSLTEAIGYGGWNGHAYKHYTAQEHRERLGAETYGKLRVFTIVRNPFDRLVSLCAFIRKPTHVLEPEEFQMWVDVHLHPANLQRSIPCLYVGQRQQKPVTTPMCDFVESALCDVWDVIIRYEHFDEALSILASAIRVKNGNRLPRRNWTRRFGDYRLYYNDRTVERVSELYADDLQRFGYTFEG